MHELKNTSTKKSLIDILLAARAVVESPCTDHSTPLPRWKKVHSKRLQKYS